MSKFFVLLLFFLSFGFNLLFIFRTYQSQIVIAVPDGDSIDLADGRRIRLLGIDAPERGRCGSSEARDRLVSLVFGKHVTFTDVVKDNYGRQLANVFYFRVGSSEGPTLGNKVFVNKIMVEEGFSRYTSVSSSKQHELRVAADFAKTLSKGIYSRQCLSSVPLNPDCAIKGNRRNDQLTYHLINCPNYSQTVVDRAFGDEWFCTEADAKAAGFTKASGCR